MDPQGGPPSAFILVIALAISLAIFVPLTGVLVRFRANYNPKGLQLDAEGGAIPHTGPVIRTYFGMMARVYRLEGWPGLYKGLMPTAISTAAMSIFILFFLDTDVGSPRHGKYRAPEVGILGTFFYSLVMLCVSLPTSIITYRAITTPHKLSYFNVKQSLQVILSSTERRRPWILYMTPGLLATEVLHIAVIVLYLGPLRRLLLPALSKPVISPSDISTFKLIIYLCLLCGSVTVLAPLEVVATRLAIQRNHSGDDFEAEPQAPEGQELPEYAGADEDVIGLRPETDPYLSLKDCITRVIEEEGIGALYRGWWITLLGGLGSSFA